MNNNILSDAENNTKLNTIDAQTLMATDFHAPTEIIEGLLHQGLYIIAGSPKVGKSWLCLWLCLQIAKGEQVWGRDTLQGSILYFCLEDTYHRLKSRITRITDDPSSNAHFTIDARDIQNGLDEQIETFISNYPDTRVVVIDTFQMIRPHSQWGYAADYNEMKIIKDIADKHNIAIILVHHLRKMPDENVLNVISGSTGITGCADGVFVLSKANHAQTASLYVTGRDIEEVDLYLKFNERCVWEICEKPKKQETPKKQPAVVQNDTLEKERVMLEEMVIEFEIKTQNFNCSYEKYRKFRDKKITSQIKKFIENNERFIGTLNQLAIEIRKIDNTSGTDATALSGYIANYGTYLWKYEGIALAAKRMSKSRPMAVVLYSTAKYRENVAPTPENPEEKIVNELIANLDKLRTTELGAARIKRNLDLTTEDVIEYCKRKIETANEIIKKGKNWYAHSDDCVITVNASSYTIITARKR